MAFTVAPTDNWNSYLSVAGSNTYLADHGYIAWEDVDDDDKKTALVRATSYINSMYLFSTDAIDADDVVEPAVEKATALLALYAVSEDLFAVNDSRDILESESSLDGVGSERVKYDARRNDRYPLVTALLRDLASPVSSGVVVGRIIR